MARRQSPSHRLLDEGRRQRTMIAIMAIMVFLTVLAAAFGLGAARSARSLDADLAGRLTVQVVEADAARRDAAVEAILTKLRTDPDVARAAEVDRARLAELLRPWLGDAGLDAGVPMPAMIDIDLRNASDAAVGRVEAIAAAASTQTRVDRNASWLAPVRRFVTTLAMLAAALVLLMALATGAVVLLAARAGLDGHRSTIDILHMLGSTDVQVARLFQRRIAIDTLTGGLIGAIAAIVIAWLLQAQLAVLGSQILNGSALAPEDWALLALLPFLFALLAMVAARLSVLRALRSRL
ncbi:cell division protein FtsX [Stakelama marina]|uniref:FtsX-like permease family protein n=1 Tax=Stakelama marina TaxID=2826939 RepID=A0A8T4IFC5_9SPHN|nr:FtsX-like permease family protein [Stakelama marina]MBR0553161.1 FtsX-like permease family protein [Stakelama marina]